MDNNKKIARKSPGSAIVSNVDKRPEIYALSRKMQRNSLGRHFSIWKLRRFVLDEKEGKLIIYSQNNHVTFDLKFASISNHHYISKAEMPDGHIISIVEKDLEMVIKFESLPNLNEWTKLLSETASKKKHISPEECNRVISAFGKFFKERMKQISSSSPGSIPPRHAPADDAEWSVEIAEDFESAWAQAVATIDDDFTAQLRTLANKQKLRRASRKVAAPMSSESAGDYYLRRLSAIQDLFVSLSFSAQQDAKAAASSNNSDSLKSAKDLSDSSANHLVSIHETIDEDGWGLVEQDTPSGHSADRQQDADSAGDIHNSRLSISSNGSASNSMVAPKSSGNSWLSFASIPQFGVFATTSATAKAVKANASSSASNAVSDERISANSTGRNEVMFSEPAIEQQERSRSVSEQTATNIKIVHSEQQSSKTGGLLFNRNHSANSLGDDSIEIDDGDQGYDLNNAHRMEIFESAFESDSDDSSPSSQSSPRNNAGSTSSRRKLRRHHRIHFYSSLDNLRSIGGKGSVDRNSFTDNANATPAVSWMVPAPRMRIVIMVVGTRGDVQPFVLLGKRFQRDGHRVRLATHAAYREYVISSGLEFYPLGGDAQKLSEFMVKTQGNLLPTSAEILREVPSQMSMIHDIVQSCWGACALPDPEDPTARRFIADAIVANPVSYGHIHCAEALGIPLHLMFPQPWIATKAFPHPLACLSYEKIWSTENYISYQVIDSLLWLTMETTVNEFRTETLGLEPIRFGDSGQSMFLTHKVPFSMMWSPSLVPKPKDWPNFVDVVGTFVDTDDPALRPPTLCATKSHSAGHNVISFLGPSTSGSANPTNFDSSHDESNLPDLDDGEETEYQDQLPAESTDVLNASMETISLEESRMVVPRNEDIATKATHENLAQAPSSEAKPNLSPHIPIHVQPASEGGYLPTPELARFLLNGPPPIFIGFGSMVIQDPAKLIKLLLEAAAIARVRVLVQSGWSSISDKIFAEMVKRTQDLSKTMRDAEAINDNSGIFPDVAKEVASTSSANARPDQENLAEPDAQTIPSDPDLNALPQASAPEFKLNREWNAASDLFMTGPCPHSWLFQQVAAVVHHGGAGTTAAGLLAGKPTWVCPFFGDQHFWGEMVFRQKCGPKPCPVADLTLTRAAESFAALLSTECLGAVAKISMAMRGEDGVTTAARSFYNHLPIENMICDVSIFCGESRLAQVYCVDCGFKLCHEVSKLIHADDLHKHHKLFPCAYKNWDGLRPKNAADGLLQGLTAFVGEVAGGLREVVRQPARGLVDDGLQGGAVGVVSGMRDLLLSPFTGGVVLVKRVREGFQVNEVESTVQVTGHPMHGDSDEDLSSDDEDYSIGGAESADCDDMLSSDDEISPSAEAIPDIEAHAIQANRSEADNILNSCQPKVSSTANTQLLSMFFSQENDGSPSVVFEGTAYDEQEQSLPLPAPTIGDANDIPDLDEDLLDDLPLEWSNPVEITSDFSPEFSADQDGDLKKEIILTEANLGATSQCDHSGSELGLGIGPREVSSRAEVQIIESSIPEPAEQQHLDNEEQRAGFYQHVDVGYSNSFIEAMSSTFGNNLMASMNLGSMLLGKGKGFNASCAPDQIEVGRAASAVAKSEQLLVEANVPGIPNLTTSSTGQSPTTQNSKERNEKRRKSLRRRQKKIRRDTMKEAYNEAVLVKSIMREITGSAKRCISTHEFCAVLGSLLYTTQEGMVKHQASVNSFLETFSKKKKTIDFVDFALLYLYSTVDSRE